MIDIHLHTKCSDGSENVIDVLKEAERIGLEYISITDHNNCKAYEELENIDINKYYSQNIIVGVELKTIVEGIEIELLGYGVDYKIINKEVPQMYITMEQKNEIELRELVKICQSLKIQGSDKFLKEYNSKEYIYASDYIHKRIVENLNNRKFFTCDDSWENSLVFYRREMCNKDSLFYIDNSKTIPTMDRVIELINKAGGLVFIPHIYMYGDNSQKIFESLTKQYKTKIDGFECYYPKFTKDQSEFLISYCKENGLYMSGGSDYHGKIKPDIKIGTGINNNLKIDSNIVKEWIRGEYLYK